MILDMIFGEKYSANTLQHALTLSQEEKKRKKTLACSVRCQVLVNERFSREG